MMTGLTLKQRDMLLFISQYVQCNGVPPTVREIGSQFHIASSSVFGHLKALQQKNFIKRKPFRSRCLEILKKDELT